MLFSPAKVLVHSTFDATRETRVGSEGQAGNHFNLCESAP